VKNTAKAKEESVIDDSLSRIASCDEKIKSSAKPKEKYATNDSLSRTTSCDEKAGVVEVKVLANEMVDDESSSIGSERKEICDDKSDANEELIQYVLKQQTWFNDNNNNLLREFLKKTGSYTTKYKT
ncbi:hypothetical protein V6N11_081574, partial [Hibiscus sabdariffa]